VNKILNLTIENWVMWLTNVQTQLVSNLEEMQKRYKDNDDAHKKK
jgi:hypothetical protein